MLKLTSIKSTGSQHLSFGYRILLSIAFLFLALLLVIYEMLVSQMPGGFIGTVITCGIVVICVLLSQLPFSRRFLTFVVPFIFLVLCALGISIIGPPLVKQEYLAEAAKIVPAYPALKLDKISFLPREVFESGASVSYSYQSTDPKEDYYKMRDFYKTELGKKGWAVFQVNENDESDYSYTIFSNTSDTSTRISVTYNKKVPSIGISVNL